MAVTSGCVFEQWFIEMKLGAGVRQLVGLEAPGGLGRSGRGCGSGVLGVALAILGGATTIIIGTATTMRGLYVKGSPLT